MRILLVDDDVISIKFLRASLERYGECCITLDGCDAVDVVLKSLVSGETYDLICLDIMMPNMNGLKALEQIRSLEYEYDLPARLASKIIMTTALSDHQSIIDAFHERCDAYLMKLLSTKILSLN